DIVKPFSSRVWHGEVVKPSSESNLRQTPVLQAVLPDVSQPIYFTAEQYGMPRFGPFGTPNVSTAGRLPQISCLLVGQADSEKPDIWRAQSPRISKQVIASRKQEKRKE